MTPRRAFWAGLAIVVLASLAYAPGLTSPMTRYDDPLYVWQNLERMTPMGWAGFKLQFDSTRAWSGEFVEFFPLRDATYWLIYQQWMAEPLPYHVTSLVFHLISSLLVWLFLSQLGLGARGAWLGGLLFALHPVHIESVVWVAGLKDPMFTSFMMMGLCAYASYRKKPATWKYVLMLAGLICGFMVKSLIIAMPVIMLLMELLLPPREKWLEIAARLFGPFVISGLFFATIMGIGRANNVLVKPHGGSLMSHVVLMVWAQVKYLKQALLPTSYRLIYCFEPPTGWTDWRLWVGVAMFVALGALAWRWRHDKLKLFFVGFYFVAMGPVSNLVPFPAIMADRYLYAPTVATCGLLALFAARLTQRSFVIVAVATGVLLTASTASRAVVWQDEESLWAEPDLDPACVTDTSYPAAQAHLLRYFTTKDRNEGLMALERAMVSPGLKGVGMKLICTMLLSATREAVELGGDARALQWARMSTLMCPHHSQAWNVAMNVTLHKRLELAAGAATKAWRLDKNPETEVLMWLTRLELGDETVLPKILHLSTIDDPWVCEKIVQFANDVPALAPQLAESAHHCAPTLARPRKRYSDDP